jgi:hypothetical protein
MRSALVALFIGSVSITSSAVSMAAITWLSDGSNYDHGNYPSAAQGVGVWADDHQGSTDNLWYQVSGEHAYSYGYGYFSTVATDTWGNYIEIHQADTVGSDLWTTIGFDNGSGANYMNGVASQFDWGMSPVIAVHGHPCDQQMDEAAFGDIVQVHQGQTGVGSLWMNVGQATNIPCNSNPYLQGSVQWGGVKWLGAVEYKATGFYPSIAINAEPGGAVACYLEVHQQNTGLGQLAWSSGVIQISGSGFGTPGTSWSLTETDAGIFTPAAQHPSVCIYDGNSGANYKDTGVVVMEFNDSSLWSFDGPIGTNVSTGNPCEWSATAVQQYDHGYYPRVSCQNGTLSNRGGVQGVEVHQGTNSTSDTPLWSHTFTDTSF